MLSIPYHQFVKLCVFVLSLSRLCSLFIGLFLCSSQDFSSFKYAGLYSLVCTFRSLVQFLVHELTTSCQPCNCLGFFLLYYVFFYFLCYLHRCIVSIRCECTVNSGQLDGILDVVIEQTDVDSDGYITVDEFKQELLSLFDENSKYNVRPRPVV